MERRARPRTRYRLPAEIVYDGARHHGFLIDVSAGGAFVQTTRSFPQGAELELWFADDQLAPQVARARVVRRRSVPASASALLRSGIGLEWTLAPQFARELEPGEIDVVIEGDGDATAALAPACAAELPPDACPAAVEDAPEPPAPADAPLAAAAPEAPGEPGADAQIAGEIVPLAPGTVLEQTVDIGPCAVRAEVALIDEGELGDIEALVRSLGASTLRMRWGAQADPLVWEAPPQIVVVSARVALAVPLSDTVLGAGALGIAVCDSGASTLRAQLRRQGYSLVVQRSAHPETLRLLFASRLTRVRERRKQKRRAFGGAVTFWRGFRRARGTLLELSPTGARLLASHALPAGAKLTLRVAARHAGGRTLGLPCEVVRSTASPDGAALLGLRFRGLSARKRARIAVLVAQLDKSGPVPRVPRRADRAAGFHERRRGPRARIAQRALVLDAATHVASEVLFGTDLSLGGMRVEPHPKLARGSELELALQPPGGAPPVLLRAVVARDDGARGLVLRFREPDAAARQALEAMLEAAAEIERTRASRAVEYERVVLGTLVEAPVAG